MEKKIVMGIVIAIVIALVLFIPHETTYTKPGNNATFVVTSSILSNSQLFSGVGDDRHCGIYIGGEGGWGNPNCHNSFDVTNGQSITSSKLCSTCSENVCGENQDKACHGSLIDIYKVVPPEPPTGPIFDNPQGLICCRYCKSILCIIESDFHKDFLTGSDCNSKAQHSSVDFSRCQASCIPSHPTNTCGTDNCLQTYNNCRSPTSWCDNNQCIEPRSEEWSNRNIGDWEKAFPQDFPFTSTFTGEMGIEVYCCECTAPGCSTEKCTIGDRRNYVCSSSKIVSSNYCYTGTWGEGANNGNKDYKTCTGTDYCDPTTVQSTHDCHSGTCIPNCVGVACNGDDGCGGKCTNACTQCPSGQERCRSDGVCRTTGTCPGNITACVGNEEIFYTNPKGIIDEKIGLIFTISHVTYSGKLYDLNVLDSVVPGFSTYYKSVKSNACCENLSYIYQEQGSAEKSSSDIFTGSQSIKLTYDVYKCSTEKPSGFCIQQAQDWLDKYTHAGDCQTNSYYLIGVFVVGLVLLYLLFSKIGK